MSENESKGNVFAIATMFALFFMIAFVTNFASPMGVIAKNQFHASNALSQLGNAANFIAYLFMGIPGGLILKRKGYKFTALGYISSFPVYVLGAFIAGFSMCMLNLVTNPLLNTLGGGGKKGNQLVQFGCSLNSVGATLSPAVLGWLIGEITKDTAFIKAAPALMIAMGIFAVAFVIVALSKIPEPHMETAEEKAARLSGQTSVIKDIVETLKFRHFTLGALAIFFYIVIEVGVPSMGMLYMTDCVKDAAGEITSKGPGYVGGAVAGVVCGAYWFLMMCGRLLGGVVGGKVSSRVQVSRQDGHALRLSVPALHDVHGRGRSLHVRDVGRHLQHGGRGSWQVRADGLGHLHGHGVRRHPDPRPGSNRGQGRNPQQLLALDRTSRLRPLLRAHRLARQEERIANSE